MEREGKACSSDDACGADLHCTLGEGRFAQRVCALTAALTDHAGALSGRVVTLETDILPIGSCTAKTCTPKDPCCNTCKYAFQVALAGERLALVHAGKSEFVPITCDWKDCKLEASCPFQSGKRYRVSGRVLPPLEPAEEPEPGSSWRLEVFAARPVSD